MPSFADVLFSNYSDFLPVCTGEKLHCAHSRMLFENITGNDFVMPEVMENPEKIGNITRPNSIKCLPSCDVQENNNQMSYAPYPQKRNFFHQKTFCHVASHVWQITCQNENRRFFIDKSQPNLCKVLSSYEEYFGKKSTCENWPTNYFEDHDVANDSLVNELYEYGRENLAFTQVMMQSPYVTFIKREAAMTFTSYVANTGGLLGLCLGFSFISGIEIIFWCCCCCRGFKGKRLPE